MRGGGKPGHVRPGLGDDGHRDSVADHGRTQLPTPQTTPASGLDNTPDSGVDTEHGPQLGNYVVVTPWELRDRSHASQ